MQVATSIEIKTSEELYDSRAINCIPKGYTHKVLVTMHKGVSQRWFKSRGEADSWVSKHFEIK